jgi:hypothetical protein
MNKLTEEEKDQYIEWLLSYCDEPFNEINYLLDNCNEKTITYIKESIKDWNN